MPLSWTITGSRGACSLGAAPPAGSLAAFCACWPTLGSFFGRSFEGSRVFCAFFCSLLPTGSCACSFGCPRFPRSLYVLSVPFERDLVALPFCNWPFALPGANSTEGPFCPFNSCFCLRPTAWAYAMKSSNFFWVIVLLSCLSRSFEGSLPF